MYSILLLYTVFKCSIMQFSSCNGCFCRVLKPYAVVRFTEKEHGENYVEIINRKWLNDDNTVCLFPVGSLAKNTKLIRELVDADDSFKKYGCTPVGYASKTGVLSV